MPKYWGKQIFAHGRFPEVGQKQKTERKKKREKDRMMVITMAKLSMAHASTHGAREPPGPIDDITSPPLLHAFVHFLLLSFLLFHILQQTSN